MITVRFFAMLKGLAKVETREYDFPSAITVAELKAVVKRDIPALSEALDSRAILISVNQEFAQSDTIVRDGDEVGFLPPFSGG
jgi:molybdopterin converting factor subunit 1